MPEEKKSQVTGNDITDSQRQILDQMSGMEMAAVLMLSLNEEDAAQIFRHLEPKQVQRLGMSMASMSDFSHDRVAAVHRQFIDDIQKYTNIGIGSEDFVRKALVAALGEDKASNLVDQIILGSGARGLDSLKWMDARQVASIIQNEHPQIQTIVLSYLEPEQSAEILSQFPEQVRLDLVMRIANLEEVQPAALQELNDIMEKQFAGAAGAQAAKMGGLKAAANIMNYLDTNIEGQLMDSIRESDEEMSQQIQDLMFVFENLIDVDDRGIQTMLREVPGICCNAPSRAPTIRCARRSSRTCPNGRPKCWRTIWRPWGRSGSPKWRLPRKRSSPSPVVWRMLARSCWAPVAARSSSKPWPINRTAMPSPHQAMVRSRAKHEQQTAWLCTPRG